jgi:Arc/MetJ-type ribon-helix-helix transcriptional regulator
MLKTISIVLSEKMIRQIDEALVKDDFGSRSEFFRIMIRAWFAESEEERRSGRSIMAAKREGIIESDQIDVSGVDLEYGIPQELVQKFAEMAKSRNK